MHRTIHISKDLGLGPFSMDEKEPQVEIRRLVGETSQVALLLWHHYHVRPPTQEKSLPLLCWWIFLLEVLSPRGGHTCTHFLQLSA